MFFLLYETSKTIDVYVFFCHNLPTRSLEEPVIEINTHRWHYRLWRWSYFSPDKIPSRTDRCSYIQRIFFGVLWKIFIRTMEKSEQSKIAARQVLRKPWIKYPFMLLTSPLWVPVLALCAISSLVLSLYIMLVLITCGIGYPTFGKNADNNPITIFSPLKIGKKIIPIWIFTAPFAIPTHLWLIWHHAPHDMIQGFGVLISIILGIGLILFLWCVTENLRWKIYDLFPTIGKKTCPVITFSNNSTPT